MAEMLGGRPRTRTADPLGVNNNESHNAAESDGFRHTLLPREASLYAILPPMIACPATNCVLGNHVLSLWQM